MTDDHDDQRSEFERLLAVLLEGRAGDPCAGIDAAGYVAGLLDAEERAVVEAHATGCAECAALLDDPDGAFLALPVDPADVARFASFPIPDFPAAPPASPRRRFSLFASRAWPYLAAAAILMLAVGLPLGTRVDRGPHVKGSGVAPITRAQDDHVTVVVLRDGRRFDVAGGVELRGDDRVGFVVSSAHAGWLSVAHLDAAGDVTLLYPDAGSTGRLAAVDKLQLDLALRVVSDGPACEAFVLVFSDRRLEPEAIRTHLTGLRSRDPARCADLEAWVPGARQVDTIPFRTR